MITIRRIKPSEYELFRQVRLAALRDSPYAFPSTYQGALERSPESWKEQADSTTTGRDRATFLAFSDKKPIGIAALYRREDDDVVGELLQVWIDPEHRGTRLAWDLMDEIFKWAHKNDYQKIIAEVTIANPGALKFYLKYGFSKIEENPPDTRGLHLVKNV